MQTATQALMTQPLPAATPVVSCIAALQGGGLVPAIAAPGDSPALTGTGPAVPLQADTQLKPT